MTSSSYVVVLNNVGISLFALKRTTNKLSLYQLMEHVISHYVSLFVIMLAYELYSIVICHHVSF